MLAFSYKLSSRSSGSFILTLALLPAVVCVVIMMVNGNVGAGVAVAGAFSLVRFRSAQGTAKEITMLFLAMTAGLIAGMGYLAYAMLCTVLMSVISAVYSSLDLGSHKGGDRLRTVRITIPEDLDYTGVFDDIFGRYTSASELVRVKTTNMGSMFKLTYDVTMNTGAGEKEMIDELRCRNGNLEISVSRQESDRREL